MKLQLPGDKVSILDHGYVQLVDVMGDDQAIVDAARLSVSGENVKTTQSNYGLIRYLLRKRHTTPFEMVEFKFRCKMPIFVARQWVRHRTASLNEMSARYSELPAEFYVPAVEDIMVQATKNKQGRDAEQLADADDQQVLFIEEGERAFEDYDIKLESGMARELARINLPLSAYTVWVWKIDLHNLMHFLSLRADSDAQMEIRVYAHAMCEMMKAACPIAFEAFEDYRLNAMYLTAQDVACLKLIMLDPEVEEVTLSSVFKTGREYTEFQDKLAILRE